MMSFRLYKAFFLSPIVFITVFLNFPYFMSDIVLLDLQMNSNTY